MQKKRKKRAAPEQRWRVQEIDESEARRRWLELKRYWKRADLPVELVAPPTPVEYTAHYTFVWGEFNNEIVVLHEPTRTFAYVPLPEYTLPNFISTRAQWWLNFINKVNSRLASETNNDDIALPQILPKGKVYVTIYGALLEITWEGEELPFRKG